MLNACRNKKNLSCFELFSGSAVYKITRTGSDYIKLIAAMRLLQIDTFWFIYFNIQETMFKSRIVNLYQATPTLKQSANLYLNTHP